VDLVVVVAATDGTSLTVGKIERVLSPSEHLAEDVVHVGTLGLAGGTVNGSPLVEILAPLWVRQNIIGRLDLFELLWIATFVGMVFHSKFPVRLLDLLICGAPLDPKIRVRVHLLFNGLLLFKMFAHGRLDLPGRGRLAGGLVLGLDGHTADVPGVDLPAGHRVLGSWDGGLGIHHKQVIVILEPSNELLERYLIKVILATGRTILDLVDDCTLWELEGNGVHVICIQNYLGYGRKGRDLGAFVRVGLQLTVHLFLFYNFPLGNRLLGENHPYHWGIFFSS